jgi:hypothetical protein
MTPHPARGLRADAGFEEIGGGGDDLFGNDAVADDPALVVQVIDEVVQRGEPLGEPGGNAVPFLRGDDARNDVERPRAIDVAALAVHREGDAHLDDGALGGFLPRFELLRVETGQVARQRRCGLARFARRADEFIVCGPGVVLFPVEFHRPLQTT